MAQGLHTVVELDDDDAFEGIVVGFDDKCSRQMASNGPVEKTDLSLTNKSGYCVLTLDV